MRYSWGGEIESGAGDSASDIGGRERELDGGREIEREGRERKIERGGEIDGERG